MNTENILKNKNILLIDGSEGSGSGTIVRYSVSLSALLQKELHLINIRAKREKKGLRPQHLKAIESVKELTEGILEGGYVGSDKIIFKSGDKIKHGNYEFDIGTAGSTTMLAMTIIPVSIFADGACSFKIKGGLFQDFAPSAYHMKYVLFPLLKNIGISAELKILRCGYVPKGEGIIEVKTEPVKNALKPFSLINQGKIIKIEGIALSSHLKESRVSERMAEECSKVLKKEGYRADIKIIQDETSRQAGAALAIFAYTDTGCIIGADMAGAPGRRSEKIGREVARNLIEDIKTGATVDKYLADQIIIYAALGNGTSEYIIPHITEHIETNLYLVEKIIGARVEINNNRVKIEGVNFC